MLGSAATTCEGQCGVIVNVASPSQLKSTDAPSRQSDVEWRNWAHPGGVASIVIFSIRKSFFILSGGPCDARVLIWSLDGAIHSNVVLLFLLPSRDSSFLNRSAHVLLLCIRC
jgi:hypothetical protein